jgi:hypothetical protein
LGDAVTHGNQLAVGGGPTLRALKLHVNIELLVHQFDESGVDFVESVVAGEVVE